MTTWGEDIFFLGKNYVKRNRGIYLYYWVPFYVCEKSRNGKFIPNDNNKINTLRKSLLSKNFEESKKNSKCFSNSVFDDL